MIDTQLSSRESESHKNEPCVALVIDTTAHRFQEVIGSPNTTTEILISPEGEKMGIIEYVIDVDNKKAHIHFLGTQNGVRDAQWEYKQLGQLDLPGEDAALKKGLTLTMMQRFITDICLPNHLERIYLDVNTPGLKEFWKGRVGNHFKDLGIFTRVSSSGYEVCFHIAHKE